MAQNKTTKKTGNAGNKKKTNHEEQLFMVAEERKKREIAAIVLLVSGVLFLLIAAIKGESGWLSIHNAVIGVFGFCAFVIPILLIYLAVILSMDRFNSSIIAKGVEVVLLLVFLSSAIFVFKSYDGSSFSEFAKAVSGEFSPPDPLGSGVFGAVFGFTTGSLLGPTGAKIITIVATITDLMVITGTTVSKLTNSAKKVHDKAKDDIEDRRQRRAERREQEAFERQQLDELAYDEEKIYRSHKTPDLDILDPEPDVLTGEEIKRTQKQPKKGRKKKAKAEPVEDQLQQEGPEIAEESFSEDEFEAKMLAINEAERKRKKEQKLEKQESIYTKEQTLEQLDEAKDNQTLNSNYKLPDLRLLDAHKKGKNADDNREVRRRGEDLIETLSSFGVEAELVGITRGPTVTRYDIKPAIGVRINKITNLSADLALSLATSSIRIAPIPNKSAIGIEVPNTNKNLVGIRSLLESDEFAKQRNKKLTVALGDNIAGEPQFADLAKMPHLLVAGTTGSGKSVCLNSMIISILYNATPEDVQFIMIDPKGVELSGYNGIPHMPTPVVKNANKAAGALAWAVKEMMTRYALLEKYKVKDIKSYNRLAKGNPDMPHMTQFVIIIDELADLMMVAPGEVEDSICRLAQMARAAGMHLVIATQSPRADVITGLIKSNIPSRIALSVANGLESRIIIDQNGAEQLLGNGDMLFNPIGSNKPTRIQGCFVSEEEIERVIDFIKGQGDSEYNEEIERQFDELSVKEKGKKSSDMEPQGESSGDELIDKAIEVILEYQTASTSFIQRKLSVGYARGARIIDELEEMGIIGPQEGAKPRKILITKNEWLERNAMSSNDQLSMSTDLSEEGEE